MFKRFVATMVSVIMVMTMTPFAMAETERSDADAGKNTNEDLAAFEKLDEGDYAPGEVIVVFKEGAVKDRSLSLKSARKNKALSLNAVRKLEQVNDSFGETMDASGEPYRMLIAPDHPTPICVRTHTANPVPYLLYDSECPRRENWLYNEADAQSSGNMLEEGFRLMDKLFER